MRSLVTAMMLTTLTIVVFATFGVAAADPSPPAGAHPAPLAEHHAEHHAEMGAVPASMAGDWCMSGSDGHMEMMGGGSMMDGWTGDLPGMDGMHGEHHGASVSSDQ